MIAMTVVRPQDLLHFDLQLDFVDIVAGHPPMLRRQATNQALLTVTFPPQSVAEQYFNVTSPTIGDPRAWRSRAIGAGRSRLVFVLVADIPYTLEALLDWNNSNFFSPQLAPVGTPGFSVGPQDARYSVIEAPYGLYLSPRTPRWNHSVTPVVHDDISELWHTRLAAWTGDAVREDRARCSVVGTRPNPPPSQNGPAICSPIDSQSRDRLVTLTTSPAQDPDVSAVQTRLMLTALGATLKADGAWDPTDGTSLVAWHHRSTLGRDQYCEVVNAGFLYPTRHPAVWVSLTERKQAHPTDGTGDGKPFVGGYLLRRNFILIKRRIVDYSSLEIPAERYKLPFQSIEILEQQSPDLDQPGDQTLFWPKIGGDTFAFNVRAVDWSGRTVAFPMKLMFMSTTALGRVAEAAAAYAGDNRAAISGDKIAFAALSYVPNTQPVANGPDLLTSLETTALSFSGATTQQPLGLGDLACTFVPELRSAEVRIPSPLPTAAGTPATLIQYADNYLSHGFDALANPGQVFAQLCAGAAAPPLRFNAGDLQQALPLITPNLDVDGLSTIYGAVADAANVGKHIFDPAQYFGNLASLPQLIGGVFLKDVLQQLGGVGQPAVGQGEIPQLTTTFDDATNSIRSTFHWETTKLKGNSLFKLREKPDPPTKLTIDGKFSAAANLQQPNPTYSVAVAIDSFGICLSGGQIDLVTVWFDHARFTRSSQAGNDVDIKVAGIDFGGPLDTLKNLVDKLPGAANLPRLSFDSGAISALFALNLPPVSLGAFSIRNLMPEFGFTLPLDGKPMALDLGLGDTNHRFFLSVALFGGGGFLQLALDASGLKSIECALEFGGDFAIDLFVASGHAYLLAGIYFRYDRSGNADVRGYIRAGGSVTVLGLITVSIEFYAALQYTQTVKALSAGKEEVTVVFQGTAYLVVSIDILFFSESITLSFTRQFAGSSYVRDQLDGAAFGHPQPTLDAPTEPVAFSSLMKEQDWTSYWAAFA